MTLGEYGKKVRELNTAMMKILARKFDSLTEFKVEVRDKNEDFKEVHISMNGEEIVLPLELNKDDAEKLIRLMVRNIYHYMPEIRDDGGEVPVPLKEILPGLPERSHNKMDEVAKLLGVELFEKFHVKRRVLDSIKYFKDRSPYYFTDEGVLNNMCVLDKDVLPELITGTLVICKKEDGEE